MSNDGSGRSTRRRGRSGDDADNSGSAQRATRKRRRPDPEPEQPSADEMSDDEMDTDASSESEDDGDEEWQPGKKDDSAATKCAQGLRFEPSHLAANKEKDDGKGCVFKCTADHASRGRQPAKGRHGHYGDNGYHYIREKHIDVYTFPNKSDWNLGKPGTANYWSGATPCPHEYHHILPWESLYGAMKKEHKKTLIALQKCGYNINSGENVIILPERYPDGRIMGLLTHLGGHQTYSKDISTILNKTLASLKVAGTEDEHAVNEENKKNVADKLVEWQKKQFDQIVEFSQDVWAAFKDSKESLPPDPEKVSKNETGAQKRARQSGKPAIKKARSKFAASHKLRVNDCPLVKMM